MPKSNKQLVQEVTDRIKAERPDIPPVMVDVVVNRSLEIYGKLVIEELETEDELE